MSEAKNQLVQCFGRKKNAVANASVRNGKGVLRVNGSPIELLEPASLRVKVMEPVLLLGLKRFQNLDIRVSVRGGGYVAPNLCYQTSHRQRSCRLLSKIR
jgi:small subunit ribosomal protein S16e